MDDNFHEQSKALINLTTSINKALDTSGGEFTDSIAKSWSERDKLVMSLTDGIGGSLDLITVKIGQIQKQIAELTRQKRALEEKEAEYKSHTLMLMAQCNVPQLKGEYYVMSPRKNSGVVNIVNEELIPEIYKTQVTTTKIDKKAILWDYNRTEIAIPGVEIDYTPTLSVKAKGE